MFLSLGCEKLEGRAHLGNQIIRRVADDVETGALRGTIRRECGENHVPAWPKSVVERRAISRSLRRLGEKMKEGPIVP